MMLVVLDAHHTPAVYALLLPQPPFSLLLLLTVGLRQTARMVHVAVARHIGMLGTF